MKKNWKSAPWIVRLIYLYWVIPVVLVALSFIYVISKAEVKGMWRIPFDLLRSMLETMPIVTSIDTAFGIISLLGAFYGWRLLRGSLISRAILELFSWLTITYSSVFFLFPNLQYFELAETPSGLNDLSFIWTFVTWLILVLEASVLVALRKPSVRKYANTI